MSKIFDSKNYKRLESKERYELMNPKETLLKLGLEPEHAMLDVGSGTGFFAIPAAKMLEQNKKVYALDLSADMNLILTERAREEYVNNIEIFLAKGEDRLPIQNNVIDFVLVAFVFHETNEYQTFLQNIKKTMNSMSKIAIMEWKKQEEPIGPPIDHRLEETFVKEQLEKAGFMNINSIDLNGSHYGVVGVKK